MKNQFIQEAQSSPEVLGMLHQLRDAAHLDRTHPARMAVISDLSLLWVAIADEISAAAEQNPWLDLDLLDIANQGSASCVTATRKGGVKAMQDCASHLTKFIYAKAN